MNISKNEIFDNLLDRVLHLPNKAIIFVSIKC